MFRNPMPWKNSPETPNIATWAQTDDIRPGLGWDGLKNLDEFVRQGGVFIGAVGSANFAVQFGLTHGVTTNSAGTGSRVVGSLLRTKLVVAAVDPSSNPFRRCSVSCCHVAPFPPFPVRRVTRSQSRARPCHADHDACR